MKTLCGEISVTLSSPRHFEPFWQCLENSLRTFDQNGEPCTKSLSQGQSAWISRLLLNQAALEASTFECLQLRSAPHKKTEISKVKRHMCKHVAASSGNPDRPGRNSSSTRLGPLPISAKCATSFRTVYLTTVCENGGELPGPRPLGRTHQM